MDSGQEIIRSVSRRTGFDLEHVTKIAGSLVQSSTWPTDTAKATTVLLLPLLAEAAPTDAASIAERYYNLAAHGRYPSVGKMVQNIIQAFLDQAHTHFWEVAKKSLIEVYSNIPAVKVSVPCAGRMADVLFTDDEGLKGWHDERTRYSNIIDGNVLFGVAADIADGCCA